MLSLCSCVTALQMGSGAPPLLPAHHSTSRAHAAPAAAEFWVEPPDTNLVAESALEGAATPRGSAPMIFWASSPESQRDLLSIYQSHTESEAQPPNGANTGVAFWCAHAHVHVHCMCVCTCMIILSGLQRRYDRGDRLDLLDDFHAEMQALLRSDTPK